MPQDSGYHLGMEILNEFMTAYRLQGILGLVLAFVIISRLLKGQDRLYTYHFDFKSLWLQRIVRNLLAVVVVCEIWFLWQNPMAFFASTHYAPVVCGCINFLIFVVGMWIILAVLDTIWLVLAIIWNLIKGLFSYLW